MAPVGAGEEIERASNARLGVRGPGGIARAHGVTEAGDLVLAGFDHRAQQRQRVGERAQFGEGNAAGGARHIGKVDAEGIIELPAFHLRRRLRRQRLLRPEPRVGGDARDGVARRRGQTCEQARGQRRLDRFGRHAVFPQWRRPSPGLVGSGDWRKDTKGSPI